MPEALPKILVVEDNPLNLLVVRGALKRLPCVLLTAADGHQALALVQRERPSLILMDIQIPGIDGLTLTRRLKADAATRHIPIVAVTAHAMAGDEERMLAAGCDGFIAKPIDTQKLPDLVRSFLERPAAGAPTP